MSFEIKHVTKEDSDTRLDKWFARYYPDAPFSLVQKMLRKGAIRVNGKRAKSSDRVEKGMAIKIPPSILYVDQGEQPTPKPKTPKLSDEDRAFIKSLVIYEDDHVIVLNKPSGLATQGGSKVKRHVDGLLDGLTDRKGQKPKLVHRLDRDTSGVLVLARTAQAATHLGNSFKSRDSRKYYWAITVPTPQRSEGIIDAPLAKKKGKGGERMMRDDEEGKKATTYYKVIERAHTKLAWVAFWPITGRTHQIRIHANLMNTMILGDRKYNDIDRQDPIGTEAVAEQKLHLHARRIMLPHPSGRGVLDVSADLPPHMAETWKNFSFDLNNDTDPFEEVLI